MPNYLDIPHGASPSSPASLQYVTDNAVSKSAAAGDSMSGPLTATGLTSTGAVTASGQVTGLGLNGNGALPTCAGVTHIVASAPLGHDMGGSFTLTSDSTSASGKIASVTFGTALGAAPVAVLVNVDNVTDGTHVSTILVPPVHIATTGFEIWDSATLTASKVFNVTYAVIAS